MPAIPCPFPITSLQQDIPGSWSHYVFGISLWPMKFSTTYRIPTVQKEAIQPIESALNTIPLRPYSCNPTYLSCLSPDTKGQFSMASQPNLHIFGLLEETGASRGNPRRHGENVPTPHRQWPEAGIEPGRLALWGSSANHCATRKSKWRM